MALDLDTQGSKKHLFNAKRRIGQRIHYLTEGGFPTLTVGSIR